MEQRSDPKKEDRAEDMIFCYRSKSTQVLYSIEDSPLGRRVRETRRTGLRTWLSVTGAKLLLEERTVLCGADNGPQKGRQGLGHGFLLQEQKYSSTCTVQYRG